jgi:hypothetical protein
MRSLDISRPPPLRATPPRAGRTLVVHPAVEGCQRGRALCDILDCTPADLIDPYAESAARRKTAGDPAAAVAELKPGPRPERARILDEE